MQMMRRERPAISRRDALGGIIAGGVAAGAGASTPSGGSGPTPIELRSAAFALSIDQASGGIRSIAHPADSTGMSWIGGPGNAPWQPRGSLWGLGFADLGGAGLHRARWGVPERIDREGGDAVAVTYRIGQLGLTVRRSLAGATCRERYTFTNASADPLPLRASRGRAALAIYTPCNDHYTTAADVLAHRAHAHVWAGGAAAWIAMRRMGGRPPHLGLVVTEGALDGYSIEDRDLVTMSNTRGTILVHPAIDTLAPGDSRSVAWTLFWCDGWDGFFAEAARQSPQMVRIDADRWTAVGREATMLRFAGDLGDAPRLSVGGAGVPLRRAGKGWTADLPPGDPGDRAVELTYRDGLTTRAALHTAPDLATLVEARVRFIVARQQWRRAGDPWDGAYLPFDNEAEVPVRWEASLNYGPGQERLAMSVLVARWLARGGRADPAVRASLDRAYAFVVDRLQRPDSFVRAAPDATVKRLYNWPWVAQLHLAMAKLTGTRTPLERAAATLDSFYREGGADLYAIGLPIAETLSALRAADMAAAHALLTAAFVDHGERIVARGTDYRPHEVNFEQSIVAPAAIMLLELHAATGDPRWLEAARPHIAVLEQFEGRQPDHRLHGIAIRHWDGYWFGKARLWGDTFPHYWSALSALAWWHMARATGNRTWAARARTTLRGNLSAFRLDGSASCAFVYPHTVDGQPAHRADAYANDQDWALVIALEIGEV